jgi:hypothetical protein
MMRMMKVKRDVIMNQDVCRLGNNKTNFQSELPTSVRHGISPIYTKVNLVPVFVNFTVINCCNNGFGNITFLRSDTHAPVRINE